MARVLRSRRIVTAGVATTVIVAAITLTAAGAAKRPDLPTIPADRLIASSLAAVQNRSLSMSGAVETHVDLGVPQLPGSLSGATGPTGLFGDQSFRVWRSPDGIRIAQMFPAAERDVVVTRTDAWVWDSGRFAAWHATLPRPSTVRHNAPTMDDIRTTLGATFGDVQTMASKLLSRLTPNALVSTAPPAEVAGRPAYVVRLSPADRSRTLVDRVEVALDAQTRLPVRVEIFARGVSSPVVSVGFSQLAFGAIDASMFRFTPPDGAAVHQFHRPAQKAMARQVAANAASAVPEQIPQVRWFGHGFGLVAASPVPSVPSDAARMFPFRGPIASADLVQTAGGTWVVAGLVPPDALRRVESKL